MGDRQSKECEGNQSRGNAEAFQFPVLGENEGLNDGEPTARERGTHLLSI